MWSRSGRNGQRCFQMTEDQRALVLTDDTATAELLTRAVEPLEAQVFGLQNWPEQLDATVKVVLVDLASHGDHDGILRRLRTCDAPLIAVLSSAADMELARAADDFVLRPLDQDELEVRIQRLLRHTGPGGTAPLRMYLAGTVRVQIGEQTVIDRQYRRRRAKALLVYLYLRRGRSIPKHEIMADLWPEAEATDAVAIKHTVQVLRSTLDRANRSAEWAYIVEQDGAYSFNSHAERWTDLEEFESQLAGAAHARALGRVEQALERYRNALGVRRQMFLAEFRYDNWAAPDVARLQDLFVDALESAAELEAGQGAHDRAVDLLRRAVLEDPLRERSYSQLMRELWLGGRRIEALRVYNDLREALARALDIEPRARTTRLYETIRRDERSAA
jgi:DNA-binding SARP family transcriptional activator